MTTDYAANLAMFLLAETNTVCGLWRGRMTAIEQRILFGRYLGKGMLVIDGANERVKMIVKVCFGLDHDTRHDIAWRDL